MKSIFAIVVTFHPDLEQLEQLCTILKKCASVIVVDNTPEKQCNDFPRDLCTWISNGENLGIAIAQNIGIRKALSLGAEAVALFDQDSQPDDQLLPKLVESLGLPSCGVVAPVCIDIRTGYEYPPYRFNSLGWASTTPAADSKDPVYADLIISSGSVIQAEVFEKVGFMDESFFIDYVDLEWCIRCRSARIPIKILPTVTMLHAIGNKVIKNGPITTFVHSPVRSYYRLRNSFLLFRMPNVPKLFVIHEVIAATVHHFFQLKHSQNKKQHLRMGWLGLRDGLLGVSGKLQCI